MSLFGWFDSEYEYHAYSSMEPLLADEDKKDTLNSLVYAGTRDEKLSISQSVRGGMVNGLPYLIKRYYEQGETDYYWGLPSNNFYTININKEKILAALPEGSTIIDIYMPLNSALVAVIEYLQAQSWWSVGAINLLIPGESYNIIDYDLQYDYKVEQPLSFLGKPVNGTVSFVFDLDWSEISFLDFKPDADDYIVDDIAAYQADFNACAGNISCENTVNQALANGDYEYFDEAAYDAAYAQAGIDWANALNDAPENYAVTIPYDEDETRSAIWVIYRDSDLVAQEMLAYYPSDTFPENVSDTKLGTFFAYSSLRCR
jgi:hypothetical protein